MREQLKTSDLWAHVGSLSVYPISLDSIINPSIGKCPLDQNSAFI